MSSTIYSTQSPTPVVTRRSPAITADVSTRSQRATNRRSLSGKLRNLFRKNSSSPTPMTSNERSVPPTTPPLSSIRQSSASPISARSTSEAPQLRAPAISWPFGKKKNKPAKAPSTPKTSKKKSKDKQKKTSTLVSPPEISSPVYQQENQSSIQGQVFVPRTPPLVHGSTERIQSTSSTYYESNTPKGFRDYAAVNQSQTYQQVIVPEVDVFTPPTYTSDRSRSPSMNRQRFTNPIPNEYYFHNDNSTSTVPPPFADVEVIPTPQLTHKTGYASPSNTTSVLIEKPPMSPKTTSHSPSTQPINIVPNRSQSKTGSSSTLDKTGKHSNKSLSVGADTPKLNAPSISFGSSSNEKKNKRAKSQTRTDGMTSSTSTISKLGKQDPIRPDQSWASTYGSLPDAEIMRGVNLTSLPPSKVKADKHPGISAIVQYHLRPSRPTYYNERPVTTTTKSTPTSPTRTQRFDTSTTTLNELEDNSIWSRPVNPVSEPSTSTLQRHDGYIRPLTPQQPFIQADISINLRNVDAVDGRSPPTTYRSSATVYTRDRRQFVNGGEIRTWSSQENNMNADYNNSYTKTPHIHVPIERQYDKPRNEYDQQIVPPTIHDNYDEYRYSPRAHEEELYIKEQKTIHDQEIQEEERYEVTYEYEQHHQQYSYQNQSHYDELHAAKRYTNDMNTEQNSSYSAYASTVQNERDNIYDQPSRTYLENEYKQKTQNTVIPVNKSNGFPHTYTVKRSDSYDGLGLSISADSATRTNHIIRDVEKGSPAEQAGLRKNDRLISVNGLNVENMDFGDVLILVREGLNNDNLQLSVIHETD